MSQPQFSEAALDLINAVGELIRAYRRMKREHDFSDLPLYVQVVLDVWEKYPWQTKN